ncbi:hypothetical protein [Nocardia sp. NPDC052566]|uniref:hypothetical protein n=1 Tax=Nocardia sp. NPDC052566 TaxID=3364330 RepID=UPI0037CC14EA
MTSTNADAQIIPDAAQDPNDDRTAPISAHLNRISQDVAAPLVTLEQVVRWGGARLTPDELARLRDRIPTSSIPDSISSLVGEIVDDRRAVRAATSTSFVPPPELRGSLFGGHTSEQVNTVLGRISDLSGVRVICVWDDFDGEFYGYSNFYIEDDEHELIREVGGDLWVWLTEPSNSPDCPDTPGSPADWFGNLTTSFTAGDLAYDDGLHNYAISDQRWAD